MTSRRASHLSTVELGVEGPKVVVVGCDGFYQGNDSGVREVVATGRETGSGDTIPVEGVQGEKEKLAFGLCALTGSVGVKGLKWG